MGKNNYDIFRRKAANYAIAVLITSLIQNIVLVLAISAYFFIYNLKENETVSTKFPVLFLILIFILYILHLNSAMICLFVNMSNIFSVMKVEHISGDKELKWSSILAIFPITSFIASLLAYKSIIKIKNRTNK